MGRLKILALIFFAQLCFQNCSKDLSRSMRIEELRAEIEAVNKVNLSCAVDSDCELMASQSAGCAPDNTIVVSKSNPELGRLQALLNEISEMQVQEARRNREDFACVYTTRVAPKCESGICN